MRKQLLGSFNDYRWIEVCLPLWVIFLSLCYVSVCFAEKIPSIASLKERAVLDDYYSNVMFGYNIISDTQSYASRYVGNQLNCTSCHRQAGTVAGQLPLNVAGIYPQWRAKNARLTALSLKIRECFVLSENGIMPPANAPEIIAIETYIHYLSKNQIVGVSPVGRGTAMLPGTGQDANPASGELVYQQFCAECHGASGEGVLDNPPVWGLQSYGAGSGMNDIQVAAGFIKSKMAAKKDLNLSAQQALDVSSFLHKQFRSKDPKKNKIPKLLQDFAAALGLINRE